MIPVEDIVASAVEAIADTVHDMTAGGPGSGRHCEICNVSTKGSLCPKCNEALENYARHQGISKADAMQDLRVLVARHGEYFLRKYATSFHGDLAETLKTSLHAGANEDTIREWMKTWVAYAEDGPSFDPSGKYKCGTCAVRIDNGKRNGNECAPMSGIISLEAGSCRMYVHGPDKEEFAPFKHQLTQIEAQYGERPKAKAFGCKRCKYGSAAEPDSEGRPSWCSYFNVHVIPNACCAMNEGDDSIQPKEVKAGGPGSGRHKQVSSLEVQQSPVRKNRFRVIAKDGDEQVGYLLIDHDGKKAWVDGTDLDKAYRGQGFGKAMYEKAISHLRDSQPEVKELGSSYPLSTDAEHVWNSLSKKYTVSKGIAEKTSRTPSFTLNLKAATEDSLVGDQAGTLWHGIKLTGFTGPQEEGLRAMLSRVPPELLCNVVEIKSANELGAKHGKYDAVTKTLSFNPANFVNRTQLGKGEGSISHPELTVVHEIGHSIYEALPEEKKQEWRDISGWMIGTKEGQSLAYQEKRKGWPEYTSQWTHKTGVKFTRYYAERNPNEDFADAFAFHILGKGYQAGPEKKVFIDQYIIDNVHHYPQVSIQSPRIESANLYNNIEAGGPGSGRHPYGRKPKDEKKIANAKASYVPMSKAKLVVATLNEALVAKELKGTQWGDNKPFDVVGKNFVVEVKTLFKGKKHADITMHKESLARKVAYAKKHKVRAYTVAVDMRGKQIDVLVKQGLGSFKLVTMQSVGNFAGLKGIIK